MSFSDMEVGIHGLNLWRPRKWQLAPEFCQMEYRQRAWRRALSEAEASRGSLEPWKPRGGCPAWPQGDQEKLLGYLSPPWAGLRFPLGIGLHYPDGGLPFDKFPKISETL